MLALSRLFDLGQEGQSGAAMALSSVSVVMNALRLRRTVL